MKGNPVLTLAILIGAGCSLLCAPAVSGAQVLVTHRIPAALALEALGEAVAVCAKQGYAVTAVVVDADGVRQALLRVERAKTVPIAPILAKLPNLLLFGGGVLIKFHDEVIGAIGAAGAPGGDLDENCARAGLEKIRGRLQHLQ